MNASRSTHKFPRALLCWTWLAFLLAIALLWQGITSLQAEETDRYRCGIDIDDAPSSVELEKHPQDGEILLQRLAGEQDDKTRQPKLPVGKERNYADPAAKWLAGRQQKDGSWRFDGKSIIDPNPGEKEEDSKANCPYAATALAVLAFQSVGKAHVEGAQERKEAVKKGLDYLMRNMRVGGARGVMSDAAMPVFSHALAMQALCQGYAMTDDNRDLKLFSQMAVNHWIHLQGEEGGWKGQEGDLDERTLTAYGLLALRTGHLAFLNVPSSTVARAVKFTELAKPKRPAEDADRGAENPQLAASTWILLSAMLSKTGERDRWDELLDRLIERGPQRGEMQTNYFITRAIIDAQYRAGWDKWRKSMREQLLADQVKEGDDADSWHYEQGEAFNSQGGRLYCTAMALLILRHCDDDQRPYRAPPREEEDEFPR